MAAEDLLALNPELGLEEVAPDDPCHAEMPKGTAVAMAPAGEEVEAA